MQNRMLIIDDEDKLRQLLARIIELEWEDLDIHQAGTLKAGMQQLKQFEFDLVISDVKLPDGNGVDFVLEIKKQQPLLEVILMTAYGQIADGVQAIKNGAFDYMTKGDDNNKIIPLLHKAFEKVNMAKRIAKLEAQVGKKYSFDQIIGHSKALRNAIILAEKVAPTDSTVLLLGDTGTGKEVFAQSIHFASRRAKKSFLAINCSAFGKELLESELFGHIAGAFTGAMKDKSGLFEEAHMGTIFLDEIGEMPLELQAKFLRVLESGEYIKVGESKIRKVDVRVIAATNRDLEQEVEAGHFRADLFYRLSVFNITLPSLNHRVADIPALVEYFVALFAGKMNRRVPSIDDPYIVCMQNHHWKGNVRELKNVVERSLILMEGDHLTVESLPYDIQVEKPHIQKVASFALQDVEKSHISRVLAHTQGNKAEAARLLGIGIATLYRKIEEYDI
ncbi:response regulator [Sphingobacterium sp. DK4209]|uniref:Response regulator n=1 Tax=Sphingobacterium zhuxiongii TaxID=2662364 RepID=A0A5Q0QFK6_9SPHI|nr:MULTISPECIES: sigma-54 dependent transcriptional regulator [unclassified Sphingobacterium]MVZ65257.1 response regulator [Sphingobacterium sp. DK4209]QGA26352.1 response regulator [Sphingobacterium sp. dk4302]